MEGEHPIGNNVVDNYRKTAVVDLSSNVDVIYFGERNTVAQCLRDINKY